MAHIWAHECMFVLHADDLACCLTLDSAGINIPISSAIIAITTSNSIHVKPVRFRFARVFFVLGWFNPFELHIYYLQLQILTVCFVFTESPDAHKELCVL